VAQALEGHIEGEGKPLGEADVVHPAGVSAAKTACPPSPQLADAGKAYFKEQAPDLGWLV
jgi:hypothetical protein